MRIWQKCFDLFKSLGIMWYCTVFRVYGSLSAKQAIQACEMLSLQKLESGLGFYSVLRTVEIQQEIVITFQFSLGLVSVAVPSIHDASILRCSLHLIAINMRDPFRHLSSFIYCYNNITKCSFTCTVFSHNVSYAFPSIYRSSVSSDS